MGLGLQGGRVALEVVVVIMVVLGALEIHLQLLQAKEVMAVMEQGHLVRGAGAVEEQVLLVVMEHLHQVVQAVMEQHHQFLEALPPMLEVAVVG